MFSEREEKIIKIIGKNRITIEDLTKKLFKDEVAIFDAEITVGNSIRRIIKKCEHHKLDWTLFRNKDERRLIVTKISTVKNFSVRKAVGKDGYTTYKYSHKGECWSLKEMEEQGKITLSFSENMTEEDQGKVLTKWSHKL